MSPDMAAAIRQLEALAVGDPVLATIDGRTLPMRVSVTARRADGAFGSPESTRVTVSLGAGHYSTEIVADRMVERRGLPQRFALEPDHFVMLLDHLLAARSMAELSAWQEYGASVWAAEHDALFELRAAELEAGWSLPESASVPQGRPSVVARRAVPYREGGKRRERGRRIKVRGGVL